MHLHTQGLGWAPWIRLWNTHDRAVHVVHFSSDLDFSFFFFLLMMHAAYVQLQLPLLVDLGCLQGVNGQTRMRNVDGSKGILRLFTPRWKFFLQAFCRRWGRRDRICLQVDRHPHFQEECNSLIHTEVQMSFHIFQINMHPLPHVWACHE